MFAGSRTIKSIMRVIKYNSGKEMNDRLIYMFQEDIQELLGVKDYLNIGIATGNTFSVFIRYLNNCSSISLDRINLFMIDEYAGVNPEDLCSCAIDLITEMTCLNRFRCFYTFTRKHYLDQIKEYNSLLLKHPFDLLFLGIGENGHYGFCNRNDGFLTADSYKLVEFSEDERQLHVKLGWFDDISEVPLRGITITEFGVLNSNKVVFAAYYDKKKTIIDKILCNSVEHEMAIFPLLSKDNCILLCG